ncbi:MAG TPA: hypothetical protein VMU89_25410 [Thermomicrobiaceae bacterium]|nr:hypothetical protein [Thermomicrobiaceae bacterium]
MSTLTITPTPFQTVFDDAGAIVSGALVYTYLAGTSTPATTYADVNGATPNANPIVADSAGRYTAFLAPGTSYKFLYETAAGATLRTADNIGGVPANSAGVDVVGTAGEALTAGQAVYLSDGSGSKTAGDWYKADNTNAYSSTTNLVGVVTADIASGATGTVRLQGSVTGFSSLSIGSTYYVGTGGSVVTTQPAVNTRRIGWADTTSSVVVQPEATSPVSSQTIDGPTGSDPFLAWALAGTTKAKVWYDHTNALLTLGSGTALSGLTVDPVTGYVQNLIAGALLDVSTSAAGQIKFPATSNLSSNANTIDAYAANQTWTPVASALTVSSGSATLTGTYLRVGRLIFWTLKIAPPAGQTTSSAGGTTNVTGLPVTPANDTVAPCVDDGLVSHGNALLGGADYAYPGYLYTPTWTTVASVVELSGVYQVANGS